MNTLINVYDEFVNDREGLGTWIWKVYQDNAVVSVEFTKGKSGLTERVEFAQPHKIPRPWLRGLL